MKNKAQFNVGNRVSLAKQPDCHGTIVEISKARSSAFRTVYIVRWDETPKQCLVQYDSELVSRSTPPRRWP